MELLTLVALLIISFALAVAGARSVLVLVFRLMAPADDAVILNPNQSA